MISDNYSFNTGGGGNSGSAIYFSADVWAFMKASRKAGKDINQRNNWKRY
jgi:hypothetical protein